MKIELLKGTMVIKVIAASISIGSEGYGSKSWRISSTQTVGRDYKIRINNTSNSANTDTSNAVFIIGAK